MAENKLIIDLLIEDKNALSKLKKSLGEVNSEGKKSADSISSSFKTAAIQIGAVIAAYKTMTTVIGGAVKQATAQEDAINRLNTALRAQGTFTENYSRSLQGMAREFQRTTRFADDAILQAQQTLITFGNVAPNQIQKVTQATLDFATAQRIDLASAADLMAKASAGFTSSLSRYGIKIDETIPKSQRFNEVLRQVSEIAGGAAQSDVNTFAGQVAQLGNVWNDTLKEIGKIIIESPAIKQAISDISAGLVSFSGWISENKEGIQNFIQDIINLGKAYEDYAIALGKATKAQLEQRSGFSNAGIMGLASGATQSVGGFIKRMFLGEDPAKTQQEIIDSAVETQTLMNETLVEAQRMHDEANKEQQLTDSQQEIVNFLLKEEQKIQGMREMWNAWNNEKLANEMIANQQEMEMYQFKLETMKLANQSMWKLAGTLRDQFSSGVSSMLSQAIRGTINWKEAFTELGLSMVDSLIKFGVQLAVNKALSSSMLAATTAESVAAGSAMAAAYAPAALAASLASFGANATAASAGITATGGVLKTTMMALKGISGLAEGGTTTTSGTVLVGERGPEFLNLPRGASVVPLDKATGSGDTYINIELNNVSMNSQESVRDLAEQVSEFINNERRRI